jgi:transposase
MEDRPVFGRDDKTSQVYVSQDARKHWSDKNPKKFNPDTAIKVIEYVGSGCFLETAAAAAGLSKVTLYKWMRLGENKNDPGSTEELRAWKVRLDEAEAMAEARAVQGIQEAGAQSWQAYAWFLERKYPQRWRQRNTVIPENPDGSPYNPPKLEVSLFRGGADATTAAEAGAKDGGQED